MGFNVVGYTNLAYYCSVAILPVITKDLPISPRFSPYYVFFYRDASSALLQLVNQLMIGIILFNHVLTVTATEARTNILL